MSRSTRSGGLFSMLRSADSPSSATLNLYSSRSACTRMSTFVFTSSTTSTRLSESSFTSLPPGGSVEHVREPRLRLRKRIPLHHGFELVPIRRRKQRPERLAVRIDEVAGGGVRIREQHGERGRGLAGALRV